MHWGATTYALGLSELGSRNNDAGLKTKFKINWLPKRSLQFPSSSRLKEHEKSWKVEEEVEKGIEKGHK